VELMTDKLQKKPSPVSVIFIGLIVILILASGNKPNLFPPIQEKPQVQIRLSGLMFRTLM
jgi:hypothetical protein